MKSMKLEFLTDGKVDGEIVFHKGEVYDVSTETGSAHRWIRRGIAVPFVAKTKKDEAPKKASEPVKPIDPVKPDTEEDKKQGLETKGLKADDKSSHAKSGKTKNDDTKLL